MATGTVSVNRNPVIDLIDVLGKAGPIFFGREEKTSGSTSVDPRILQQQQQIYSTLLRRGSSTAQADKVIEDILYRAQLAFAPVLGEEKQAGVYNTTVRRQMASESVARATAAAAQTVMEDQQRALQMAAQLNASTQANTRSSQQTTKTPGLGQQILKGVGTSILANEAYKLGKKGVGKGKDIISQMLGSQKSTQGFDELGFQDIEDYFLANDGSSFNLGALNAPGGAGDFSSASFAQSGFGSFDATSGSFIADDTAALQELLESTTIPEISEGVQVADSGQTITDANPEALFASAAPIDAASVETLGPIATQKALEAQGIMGLDAASIETIGPIGTQKALEAGAAAGGTAAAAAGGGGIAAAEGAAIAEGMVAASGAGAAAAPAAAATPWGAIAVAALSALDILSGWNDESPDAYGSDFLKQYGIKGDYTRDDYQNYLTALGIDMNPDEYVKNTYRAGPNTSPLAYTPTNFDEFAAIHLQPDLFTTLGAQGEGASDFLALKSDVLRLTPTLGGQGEGEVAYNNPDFDEEFYNQIFGGTYQAP